MILGKDAIRERLNNGEVFKDGTWVEESIMEASYALRVASDGLLLGGRRYKPGEDSIDGRIEIEPGEIGHPLDERAVAYAGRSRRQAWH